MISLLLSNQNDAAAPAVSVIFSVMEGSDEGVAEGGGGETVSEWFWDGVRLEKMEAEGIGRHPADAATMFIVPDTILARGGSNRLRKRIGNRFFSFRAVSGATAGFVIEEDGRKMENATSDSALLFAAAPNDGANVQVWWFGDEHIVISTAVLRTGKVVWRSVASTTRQTIQSTFSAFLNTEFAGQEEEDLPLSASTVIFQEEQQEAAVEFNSALEKGAEEYGFGDVTVNDPKLFSAIWAGREEWFKPYQRREYFLGFPAKAFGRIVVSISLAACVAAVANAVGIYSELRRVERDTQAAVKRKEAVSEGITRLARDNLHRYADLYGLSVTDFNVFMTTAYLPDVPMDVRASGAKWTATGRVVLPLAKMIGLKQHVSTAVESRPGCVSNFTIEPSSLGAGTVKLECSLR